jgi:hypothetical protein
MRVTAIALRDDASIVHFFDIYQPDPASANVERLPPLLRVEAIKVGNNLKVVSFNEDAQPVAGNGQQNLLAQPEAHLILCSEIARKFRVEKDDKLSNPILAPEVEQLPRLLHRLSVHHKH